MNEDTDDLHELAQEANRHLLGPDQAEWLARLDREQPALEALLEGFVAAGEGEKALSLAGALARYWWMRGHAAAGLVLTRRALALPGGSERARAAALIGAGSLLYATGDFRGARDHHERAVKLLQTGEPDSNAEPPESSVDVTPPESLPSAARALDGAGMAARQSMDLVDAAALHARALGILCRAAAPAEMALCLSNLGVVAFFRGDLAVAREHHEEALALRERVGDTRGRASSFNNLGQVARVAGDLASARILTERALRIRRRLGDVWGAAGSYCNLAIVTARLGDTTAARSYLREALAGFRAVSDPLGICECLEAGAELAGAEGRWADAVALVTTASERREALPAPRPPIHANILAGLLADARAALGEDAYAVALRERRDTEDLWPAPFPSRPPPANESSNEAAE
jgi:tetratricopeptide (TPR) repeat protein